MQEKRSIPILLIQNDEILTFNDVSVLQQYCCQGILLAADQLYKILLHLVKLSL